MGTINSRSGRRHRGRIRNLLHRRIPGSPQLPRLQHSHPGGSRRFRGGHLPPLERLAAQSRPNWTSSRRTWWPTRGFPGPVIDFLQSAGDRQSDGRAAHRRLDAEPLRSRSAGHVHRGQPPQGGAPDVARPPTSSPPSTACARASRSFPAIPSLGFSANFLYTLTGKRPDDVMERAFDVALTLHADHELNASTFAARVTAATLSDIYSSITSGIGALKGPLHGGANQDVIKLLLQAGRRGRGRRTRARTRWRRKSRFRASAIACTAPRIRARRTCACFPRNSASAPATRSSTACRSAWKRRSRARRT